MAKRLSSQTPEAILAALNAHADRLRALGAVKIGLFGSYRRGTPRPGSDMDFLVTLARPSFDDYMSLKFFLEDLFACDVDLVLEGSVKPRLRPAILSEVVYAQGL